MSKWEEARKRIQLGEVWSRESWGKHDRVYYSNRVHLAPVNACCGRITVTDEMVKKLGSGSGLVVDSHIVLFRDGLLSYHPKDSDLSDEIDDWIKVQ